MKTRDAEALQYVLESGLWKVDVETGEVLTRRDRHGRDTEPPVWRPCTFPSPSKNSSTRKRIWVNGRRVYANRVVWVLTHKRMIPEGYQIDHKDDNSLNDRPDNLELMDAEGNRVKELANGKVHRFQRCPPQPEASTVPGVLLDAYAIEPARWYCIDGRVSMGCDTRDQYSAEIYPGVVTMVSHWVDGIGPGLGDWSFIGPRRGEMVPLDYIGPHETVAINRPPVSFKETHNGGLCIQVGEPIDWRISLWEDIKAIWKAFRGR